MRWTYATLLALSFIVACSNAASTAIDSEKKPGLFQNDIADFPIILGSKAFSGVTKRSLRLGDTLISDADNTNNEERAITIPGLSRLTELAKKGKLKARNALEKLQYRYWRKIGKTDASIYNRLAKKGKTSSEIYKLWRKFGKTDESFYRVFVKQGRTQDEIYNLWLGQGKTVDEIYALWKKLGNSDKSINDIWVRQGKSPDELYNLWAKQGKPSDQIYRIWHNVGNSDESIYNIWVKQGKSMGEIYNIWLKVDKKPQEVYNLLNLSQFARPNVEKPVEAVKWRRYLYRYNAKHGISNK
ncbi:Avirulence (Avh) protein [Phytophthora megakarya]|uniref:RxLR effector protein n=1 Tax=Phytophthora megakarya TaxID=4795 RepID=A0A225V9Q7_9STRA|nr:Avirulence (Avh) protein [Phytophthora megakarya]